MKKKGEDFLGLITLGSLIANLVQVDQRKALQAHYDNMLRRYKQLYSAYSSMKRVNEGLSQEVRTLNTIISRLREENNRLLEELATVKPKGVKIASTIHRRRRISSPREAS